MPADGTQYLVTQQTAVTTRGDTSTQTHLQTVSYDGQTDTTKRNLTHPKVTTQTQAHEPGAADEAEAVTTVPRSIASTFDVEFVGPIPC